jgi:hypothetical protein
MIKLNYFQDIGIFLPKRQIAQVSQEKVKNWISGKFRRVQGQAVVAEASHDPGKEHHHRLEKSIPAKKLKLELLTTFGEH